MPSSSSSSRRIASRGCSPSSILPPGNSHLSGIVWCLVRWQISSFPSCTISAAATSFIAPSGAGFFHELPDHSGAVLHQFTFLGAERGGEVAVYVEFTHHLSVHKNRHDDFGLRLQ